MTAAQALRLAAVGACGTLQTAVEMGVPNAKATLAILRAALADAIKEDSQ